MVLLGISEEPPRYLYDRSSSFTKLYKREEQLGKGSFARVYLLKERIGEGKFAVKTFCKELFKEGFMETVKREMSLHQRLAHKNIIKFHNSFETDKFLFMVLEWAQLKTLKEVSIKRVTVTEAEARYYFCQIAAGLKYLSDKKILHRDIKLANLLLAADMTAWSSSLLSSRVLFFSGLWYLI